MNVIEHDTADLGSAPASIRQLLARRRAAGSRHLSDFDVPTARQWFDYYTRLGDIPPRDVHRIEAIRFDTRGNRQLPARVYYPAEPSLADPLPALLYFHSGGYVVGGLDTADAVCRMLAVDAQCVVVSASYRLAPEHKFPCAVDDAIDALHWLKRVAITFGIDPERLAVGGESAGATLAAICAVDARDTGIVLAQQLLIYPALAATLDTDAHRRYGDGYFLSLDLIRWLRDQYLDRPDDRHDWRFAPLDGACNAPADWRGLAPTWIASAEFDPLRDEHEAYAERLVSHGNTVALHVYPGMIHGFFSMGRLVPEARDAHRDAAEALRKAFSDA
ncbi:alpha/beta hydrolase [Burkholderia ambifaria]|uniref:Alpha/beta hydrolase n=1 Tax=Burkholderia ambifaria TaxID=152480 RepID=A0AA41E973_9BURK|nr:alpha/beta hydrolase [Burkholderia ambifaria]MBR8130770.1 alpha/beta hydrolase [Burkholderia ambifaria]PRD96953.1 alpha/beta hydrolase [Burkholderia ambifaria]